MQLPMGQGIDIGDYVMTKNKTNSNSITIAAGSYNNIDVDVTETGYTPLGIVGVSFSGGRPSITAYYMRNSTSARIIAKNDTSASITITGTTAFIAYIKD